MFSKIVQRKFHEDVFRVGSVAATGKTERQALQKATVAVRSVERTSLSAA